MENQFCYYGAKFWAKVIAFFELIWFSFFLCYFILGNLGIFENTLIFSKSTLNRDGYFYEATTPKGLIAEDSSSYGNSADHLKATQNVHAHEYRKSMLIANLFIGLYFSLGLFMSLVLLRGILLEKPRYLKFWILFAVMKYIFTTIVMIVDRNPLCDFIIYSIALMFGTAFCISAVRALILELKSRQEQREKILPFRLSLDNLLVQFNKNAVGIHQKNPSYQVL